jgi:predicted CoA-binding protein
MSAFADWIICKVSKYLLKNDSSIPGKSYYTDFKDLAQRIKVGDVLLVAGRNRVSAIIRHVTLSPWTHASLYIGRLKDIQDPVMLEKVKQYTQDEDTQFIIESEVGTGTTISDLYSYQNEHVRLLRPQALTADDAQRVIDFAISRLGMQYDVRHLLDLARFLFPWGFLPKRWRSSLFEHNALQPTKDICSSVIADAFQTVDFPILPLIEEDYVNELAFIRRNDRLYTPSDFDYSPYFDVIKCPWVPLKTLGAYHDLPWMKDVISDDDGLKIVSTAPEIKTFFASRAFGVIGASTDRTKFGNKVLRCYLQKNKKVYPVNPKEKLIEGIPCVASIAELPGAVKSISIITPPAITERIVDEAIAKGIKNIWMQPGAESDQAIENCKIHNINVIAGGPCILQLLRFHDEDSNVDQLRSQT